MVECAWARGILGCLSTRKGYNLTLDYDEERWDFLLKNFWGKEVIITISEVSKDYTNAGKTITVNPLW